MQSLMVSLRGRGYTRLCLIGWAPEGCECQGCESAISASAQRAARSHYWCSTAAWHKNAGHCTSSSSSSSETEAMQNVSKDFHVHICCLEREWVECEFVCLLPCRVASGICKVSLTSAVMPTPLCRSQHTKDSVWIRRNIMHSWATVSAALLRLLNMGLFVFLSVLIEAFIKV